MLSLAYFLLLETTPSKFIFIFHFANQTLWQNCIWHHNLFSNSPSKFNGVLNIIVLVLLWFIMSITTHVKDFERQILPLSRHIQFLNPTFLKEMWILKHVKFFSKRTKHPFWTKLTLKFYLGWRRCPLPCILHPIWYAFKKCW